MRIVYDMHEPWQAGGGARQSAGGTSWLAEVVLAGEDDAIHIEGDLDAILATFESATEALRGMKEAAK